MKKDFIEKLPPDAQKEFLKLAMKLEEKSKKEKVHGDFLTFVKHVWPEFIEGEHHKVIADKFNRLARGEIKRLIINMPPRHTKSEFGSFLLPSWMVGRRPNLKIIQSTHTTELAIRFGRKAKRGQSGRGQMGDGTRWRILCSGCRICHHGPGSGFIDY